MDFPYTKSVKSIPRLFEEIRKVGTPSKVTVAYLKSIGFTSSNDSYLVSLLKGVGFVDGGGGPTERWKSYRGNGHRQVMADAVRDGYSGLYGIYPDAHKRDDEAVANVVRQNSNYGSDTVARVVGSFKALCDLADFEAQSQEESTATSRTPVEPGPAVNIPSVPSVAPTNSGQPIINLNIQLELPAQADEKFYDNFFEAMKKHLMP